MCVCLFIHLSQIGISKYYTLGSKSLQWWITLVFYSFFQVRYIQKFKFNITNYTRIPQTRTHISMNAACRPVTVVSLLSAWEWRMYVINRCFTLIIHVLCCCCHWFFVSYHFLWLNCACMVSTKFSTVSLLPLVVFCWQDDLCRKMDLQATANDVSRLPAQDCTVFQLVLGKRTLATNSLSGC